MGRAIYLPSAFLAWRKVDRDKTYRLPTAPTGSRTATPSLRLSELTPCDSGEVTRERVKIIACAELDRLSGMGSASQVPACFSLVDASRVPCESDTVTCWSCQGDIISTVPCA